MVGDNEGVVAIPAHVANSVAEEAYAMTLFETFVSREVHGGRGIFGLYPPTDPDTRKQFEAWKATQEII